MSLWSFQGARAVAAPDRKAGPRAGLSKLSSKRSRRPGRQSRHVLHSTSQSDVQVEVDVVLGESDAGRKVTPSQAKSRLGTTIHQRVRRLRSKSSGFPRKEVIQPQLPLRLP